ncbi:MAG: protein of unknown function containing DUF377 domain [Phormidium sp. OSCR]|nr:MAG: protein of unknown function containing DUF377 domain [Phormidium sp. OSCR]
MKWKKLGRVFCPDRNFPWMLTHASVPVVQHVSGDDYKIYFSCRDSQNRSHAGWVYINLLNPCKILDMSSSPILKPGELGTFDDSGVMPTWLVRSNQYFYMYYIGWNLGVTVPFRNSVGLALSTDGINYKRYAPGPILDRTSAEPHFCASCCVIPDENIWKMWYLSCTKWVISDGNPQHYYHIKYAESTDGINWNRNGQVAIDFSGSNEYAISRPTVIRDSNLWRIWYSYRGSAYKIGYAESENGITWHRMDDKSGIHSSSSGWDSEMIEYPLVFDHNGQRFMAYNGNEYGKTGFGIAVLE